MPYADPDKQQAYDQARQERRKHDQAYKDERNRRQRERYKDPEYRAQFRAQQTAWRQEQRRTNPDFRAREARDNLHSSRKWRGLRWTPEEEAAHNAKTTCEVCGNRPDKTLHADHCHGCGAYRGALCSRCNTAEGYLRRWSAVCPEGSPMRAYVDRHTCEEKIDA